MSIVTRTGDTGKTQLFSGETVTKNHERVEAYGDLDELSSAIGVLISQSAQWPYLETIQRDLFFIGAILANPKSTEDPLQELNQMEKEVLELESTLSPLSNFILPGGSPRAAACHLARAVARRAERHAVKLPELPPSLIPYLNRLSDYLFLLARHFNREDQVPELPWKRENR